MRRQLLVAFLLGVVLPPLFAVGGSATVALAQPEEAEELQQEIQERNNRLAEIEREIAQFEAELQEVGAEKETLQSAIRQLELERQKINAELAKTENQITSTDLQINKLVLEIKRTERDIDESADAIASIIRQQYRAGDDSLIELLLRHERLSEFWNTYEAHENVRDVLTARVTTLQTAKTQLAAQRAESEARRAELANLKEQYTNQNQVLLSNKDEQAELLEVTRNEEQSYQQLLADRRAAQEQILRELREFESQLQFILDPNTIPAPGTRVFDWPVQDVVITQRFGGTEFAARNAAAYGGRPYHPGVDFGAPRGTPIHAPLNGTGRAVGNTDAVPGCYSWGKWTLIDHANGLSTLYAHQDVIAVSPGQKVSTGDRIGYIGNTGFSTGPHLHFTVYVKEAVSVRRFSDIKTVTSCGAATTPVAATEGYLDPMLYLPPT
ncbi:MAG: murein hydrolase activator EnvC family protein [Patescibacteria group bacterium]